MSTPRHRHLAQHRNCSAKVLALWRASGSTELVQNYADAMIVNTKSRFAVHSRSPLLCATILLAATATTRQPAPQPNDTSIDRST